MGKKCFVFFCYLIVWSAPVFASGFLDTYGLGTRSMSLGGAFVAVADDYSAAFHNPAGLGQLTGNRFTFDFIYTSPDIKVDKLDGEPLVIYTPQGTVRTNPVKYRGGKDLSLTIPVIGLNLSVNSLFNLPWNTQFGAAISLPEKNDVMYRMYSFPPDQPHLLRYGNDIDRVELCESLGVEVVSRLLYLGGGIQSMIYGDGTINVDGMTPGVGAEYENVVSQVDVNILLKHYPVLGVLITPLDQKLKIGLSWRDDMEVLVDPRVNSVTTNNLGGVNLVLISGVSAFYTPEEYSLGISYTFDDFMISVQADRQLWSNYTYSPQDALYYSGSPDFDDTTNIKLGIEYKPAQNVSIMLGYTHQPTPVPDQSDRISNYLDMDKDIFSLGGSYDFYLPSLCSKPITVGGLIQYQKLDSYTVSKENAPQGITWKNQESYQVEGRSLAAGMRLSLTW